jgi:hypothetical protein
MDMTKLLGAIAQPASHYLKFHDPVKKNLFDIAQGSDLSDLLRGCGAHFNFLPPHAGCGGKKRHAPIPIVLLQFLNDSRSACFKVTVADC